MGQRAPGAHCTRTYLHRGRTSLQTGDVKCTRPAFCAAPNRILWFPDEMFLRIFTVLFLFVCRNAHDALPPCARNGQLNLGCKWPRMALVLCSAL